MSDFEMSFSIPLDADGFLRRECPKCEREFKWRPSEGDGVPIPALGYACPYCAVRSPPDHWWTKTQLEYAERLAASEILGPELRELEHKYDPESMISFDVSVSVPETPEPLADEENDMRRIDFACHPGEPIKVLEDWRCPVHCLICAAAETSN